MGPKGMSSDEEEFYDGRPFYPRRFRIHVPAFRNPEVTRWLRVLDRIYLWLRDNRKVDDARGAELHLREEGAQPIYSHKDIFPTKMPINFYNASWLSSASWIVVHKLKPRHREQYQWTHTDEMMQCGDFILN